MMVNNVFSGRYYRMNKLLMRQIGIWPEQSRTSRIVLPTFYIVTIGSVLVPELVHIHHSWGNIDNIIEALPSVLMIFISWFKLINGAIKITSVLELFNRVNNDWKSFSKSPSSIVILERNAEKGRILTIFYFALICGVIVAFMVLPVVPVGLDVIAPLNEPRPKKYLYATNYGVDPEQYYYYILLHAYLATVTCALIYISVDAMFTVWVQHSCALFEIVGYNLRHVHEKLDLDTSKVHPKDEMTYRNLCFCIRKHKEAIIFANLIESTYSTSLAYVTGCNMVIMSVTGVLLLIKLDDVQESLRLSILTLAQIYHLYYNTVSGQKIIDYSDQISDHAYESDWSTFSPRAQKLLILIMARAQRACLLTAGKVYVINMENFSSVVKTSVTYFTVLSSLR